MSRSQRSTWLMLDRTFAPLETSWRLHHYQTPQNRKLHKGPHTGILTTLAQPTVIDLDGLPYSTRLCETVILQVDFHIASCIVSKASSLDLESSNELTERHFHNCEYRFNTVIAYCLFEWYPDFPCRSWRPNSTAALTKMNTCVQDSALDFRIRMTTTRQRHPPRLDTRQRCPCFRPNKLVDRIRQVICPVKSARKSGHNGKPPMTESTPTPTNSHEYCPVPSAHQTVPKIEG
jgi:hypothetical protein